MSSQATKISVDVLENRLLKNPKLRAFAQLADAYRKNGDIQKAIDLCTQSIKYHSAYVTGRIILGRCYLEKENYEGAIGEFTQVCQLDRRNHLAIKMLADTLARQGLTEKAGDLYSVLKHLDPFNPSVTHLSNQYKGTGKTDLFEILGFQAPEPLQHSQPTLPSGQDFDASVNLEHEIMESVDTLDPFETDNSIEDQAAVHDQVEDQGTSTGGAQSLEFDGTDLQERMAMMFGEEGGQPPVRETRLGGTAPAEPILDTAENEMESVSGATAAQSEPAQVSGTDISSRIDELFAEDPAPGGREAAPAEIKGSGQPLEPPQLDDELDFNFSKEQQPAVDEEPVAPETMGEDIGDSISGPGTPAERSLSTQEFEETLQIDRSFLESLDAGAQKANDSLVADYARTEQIAPEDLILDNKEHREGLAGISGDQPESGDGDALDFPGLIDESDLVQSVINPLQNDSAGFDDLLDDTGRDGATEGSTPGDTRESFDVPGEDFSLIREASSEVVDGDDVVSKLNDIFGDKTPGESSLPDEESGADISSQGFYSIDGESAVSGGTLMEDDLDAPASPDPTSLSDVSSGDYTPSALIDEGPGFSPASADLILDNGKEDADATNDDLVWPASPQNDREMEGIPTVSGRDIQERLDQFFPADEVQLAKDSADLLPEDEEEGKDDTPPGFYTIAGDSAIDTVEDSILETVEDKEPEMTDSGVYGDLLDAFDSSEARDTQAVVPEPVDEPEISAPAPAEPPAELDSRDRPYSIPDHVITPTLADIYFQQGQPQLALQIISRLHAKDPDNEQIALRLEQIQDAIAKGTAPEPSAPSEPPGLPRPQKARTPSSAPRRRKARAIDTRPLAGVKIKKNRDAGRKDAKPEK